MNIDQFAKEILESVAANEEKRRQLEEMIRKKQAKLDYQDFYTVERSAQ